ncbi:putative protein kinase RLK-Pelle-L-LEC family [Helianthus annuus]|nr:putative protein kinase RLK-Pelle-L-LEC family [Helianthus annuus]
MGILACFLLILIPYAASISFNLANISPNDKDVFILDGGANISEDAIQVTPKNHSGMVIGRVTYTERLHLWNKRSGELASFSTIFSFVKLSDPERRHRQDDGFIFFLAQNSSLIHGAMDPKSDTTVNDSGDRYVWVEFDPYCNAWENSSQCDHVGINVNSDSSINQTKWLNTGRECQVLIKHDSGTKNLSVSFTSFRNNNFERDGVAHIVDLRNELPEWVAFGFSAASFELSDKNTVESWMFNSSSNLQLDENTGLPLGISSWKIGSSHKNNGDEVEELGSSVVMNHELEMGATGPRKFSYLELAWATSGFAEKEKLGEGSFGGVCKGFLKDLRTYVAVKRVSKTSQQGVKEYASEVRIISRLRRRNLVQLTGWCHEKGELLLVYEYMENGSLDSHLFNAKSLLTWGTRYQIAIGLAYALLYLHEEWEQCVWHRDIKSSNVMLDSNFNAKLGDFGLAKFVDHEKGSQITSLAGTLGYMAPECVTTGRTSKESDVFSFGVVVLKIVCGRKSINCKAQEKLIWLPEWV